MTEKTDKLKAMTQLGAAWWNDSCDPEHLAEAVSQGASGATSNPMIVETVVSSNQDRWLPVVKQLAGEHPEEGAEEITWRLISEMGRQAAEVLRPVYESSDQSAGYLSLQVNPELSDDAEKMFEQAVSLASNAPNIAIKLPSTPPGFRVAERLIARGISVNTTVSFSVAQAIAAAEAIERGLEKFASDGNDPASMNPYVTIMVGRVGDYLGRVAASRDVATLDNEAMLMSGVWVFRNAARIFEERGFRSTLLAAAYRHELQWSQIIGKNVLQSMPYKWWKQFQFADCDVSETVLDPIDGAKVSELQAVFPEYNKVYQADGLAIEEFAEFEATRVTVEQFSGGYRKLVALVEGAMNAAGFA